MLHLAILTSDGRGIITCPNAAPAYSKGRCNCDRYRSTLLRSLSKYPILVLLTLTTTLKKLLPSLRLLAVVFRLERVIGLLGKVGVKEAEGRLCSLAADNHPVQVTIRCSKPYNERYA